jgi:hypothetical protein
MASISAMSSAMTVIAGNAQRSGGGKVYHLQYLPLPQGIWRRSVFFLHVVAADQAQWCTPVARTSRPVMRCAIADCGRQIMVSSATASAIAALHMRSSLMVLKSPGRGAGSCGPCCRDRHAFRDKWPNASLSRFGPIPETCSFTPKICSSLPAARLVQKMTGVARIHKSRALSLARLLLNAAIAASRVG